MGEGNSIINLGGLGKPATVLIQKISNAVGGLCQPWQIKRVAQAEAEASLIAAKSEIKVTELQKRAFGRFINEEAKKQQNMEDVAAKALPHLTDNSQPEKLDDDWVTNFFDKCRNVSDKNMQDLWSKVLAGEANSPGTYSKRTVNLIEALDQKDATLFAKLCGFAWMIGRVTPLVLDLEHKIYTDAGINFESLLHLNNIGLVSFESTTGLVLQGLKKSIGLNYYGQAYVLEFAQPEANRLDIGKVMLTQAGGELARICASQPVPGFGEFMLQRWCALGYSISSPYISILGDGWRGTSVDSVVAK